jgi:hypothetical protein
MNKTEIAKKIVRLATQYGTGMIVNSIISNNVHTERIDQKVGVAVASVAIGGVVGEAAGDHTDRMIDELIEATQSFKKN